MFRVFSFHRFRPPPSVQSQHAAPVHEKGMDGIMAEPGFPARAGQVVGEDPGRGLARPRPSSVAIQRMKPEWSWARAKIRLLLRLSAFPGSGR